MKDEQCRFLSLLGHAPRRLTAEQTAWVLNCQPHDIPMLVAARLLKPLGAPMANGTKFFSTSEVLELAEDRGWLARMTNAIYEHWRHGNRHKRNGAGRRIPRGDQILMADRRPARTPRPDGIGATLVPLEP